MATQEPGQQPSLTALPRLEDIQRKGDGYDADGVREAFEAFRRHSAQLQAQLRVLQAASRSGQTVEPTDPAATGSTLTEINPSAKAGVGEPQLGTNPTNSPLDRVRVDSGGPVAPERKQ